jgi:hypothetical protein
VKLADFIQKVIEEEPVERRPYPDLYAQRLSDAIVEEYGVGARANDPAWLEVDLS